MEKVEKVLSDYVIEKVMLLRSRGEPVALTKDRKHRILPQPISSDGIYRKVGRLHKVHHQTVKAWVMKWHKSKLPVQHFVYRPEKN